LPEGSIALRRESVAIQKISWYAGMAI